MATDVANFPVRGAVGGRVGCAGLRRCAGRRRPSHRSHSAGRVCTVQCAPLGSSATDGGGGGGGGGGDSLSSRPPGRQPAGRPLKPNHTAVIPAVMDGNWSDLHGVCVVAEAVQSVSYFRQPGRCMTMALLRERAVLVRT